MTALLHCGNGDNLDYDRSVHAIKAMLSVGAEADTRPDGKGGCHITLPRDDLDKLRALRAPGESYSDVILRIATT